MPTSNTSTRAKKRALRRERLPRKERLGPTGSTGWNKKHMLERESREQIRRAHAVVNNARDARARALKEAKATCRRERAALLVMRTRILKKLGEIRVLRENARKACLLRMREARSIDGAIAHARTKRTEAHAVRRAEIAGRRRPGYRAANAAASEAQSESDDEVRGNLDPDMVPIFNRLKSAIKARPNLSRTEAFLHYMHEHGEERATQYRQIEEDTDRKIREHELAERASARRGDLRRRGRA